MRKLQFFVVAAVFAVMAFSSPSLAARYVWEGTLDDAQVAYKLSRKETRYLLECRDTLLETDASKLAVDEISIKLHRFVGSFLDKNPGFFTEDELAEISKQDARAVASRRATITDNSAFCACLGCLFLGCPPEAALVGAVFVGIYDGCSRSAETLACHEAAKHVILRVLDKLASVQGSRLLDKGVEVFSGDQAADWLTQLKRFNENLGAYRTKFTLALSRMRMEN